MENSQAPTEKVKPTVGGMLLSLSTMVLWWDAERVRVKHDLEPGWRSKYNAISECIDDIKALLDSWNEPSDSSNS